MLLSGARKGRSYLPMAVVVAGPTGLDARVVLPSAVEATRDEGRNEDLETADALLEPLRQLREQVSACK